MTEELKPNTTPENRASKVEPISLRKKFFNVRTFVSLVLAIGLIVVIVKECHISFGQTWEDIQTCNVLYYVLAFLCYYLTFPVRALRWRYLLRHAGLRKDQGVEMPSLLELTQMVLMNWFANCILYARMGDVYRAYLFRERTQASFSKALGTVLAERFLDILVIVLLTVVAIIWLLLTGGHDWKVFGIVLCVGIVLLLVIIIVLGGMGKFGHKLVNLLPKKMRVFYTMFEQGALSSFGQLPLLTFLSVIIWLLEAGCLILVAKALEQAFHFNLLGTVGIGLFVFAAMANALISAIPLTPGGLGLVEAGVTGLLMITGLPKSQALSITLVYRTISFLSVIVVGLLVFASWYILDIFRKRRSMRTRLR